MRTFGANLTVGTGILLVLHVGVGALVLSAAALDSVQEVTSLQFLGNRVTVATGDLPFDLLDLAQLVVLVGQRLPRRRHHRLRVVAARRQFVILLRTLVIQQALHVVAAARTCTRVIGGYIMPLSLIMLIDRRRFGIRCFVLWYTEVRQLITATAAFI